MYYDFQKLGKEFSAFSQRQDFEVTDADLALKVTQHLHTIYCFINKHILFSYTSLLTLRKICLLFLYVFVHSRVHDSVCADMCACYSMPAEVRGSFLGVGSFLLPR